jgi:hypothetical protein
MTIKTYNVCYMGVTVKGYRKGPKLFSLARKKALVLGVPQEKGVKLAELICRIQMKEGNPPCFQQRDVCSQKDCCWQASCNTLMVDEQQ